MRLGFLKLCAFVFLLWETLWRSFWPLAVFLGTFLAILLLDVLPTLGWAIHVAVLVLAAAVALYLVYIGIKKLNLPSWHQATRRIENDSSLAHRPLSSLDDTPVDAANPLWVAHRKRIKNLIKKLRLKSPQPRVPEVDTAAVRVVPLILLVIAIPLAWGTSWARIDRGLTPQLPKPKAPEPYAIDAWVSPPTYTGLAPFLVEVAAVGDTLEVALPEQSALLLQIQGGPEGEDKSPTMWNLAEAESKQIPLVQSLAGQNKSGAYKFEGQIEQSASLGLFQGSTISNEKRLLTLDLDVKADNPPLIKHAEDPRMTDAGSLRLALIGGDDYGLQRLDLKIDPAGANVGLVDAVTGLLPGQETVTGLMEQSVGPESPQSDLALLYQNRTIDLPNRNPKEIDFTEFLDLASHPLAGQEVAITVEVGDFADQTTKTEVKTVKIPELVFQDPTAKQVIKLRKQIFNRPEAKDGVGVTLAALSEAASLADEKKQGVRNALNALSEQTLAAETTNELDSVVRNMWDLAKRLDDNPVRRAEEKLRKLEEQLRDALERGAPESELLALMDQLKEAMEEYQQAVINQKLAEMLESGELNITQDQAPERNAMNDLADQLEALTRKGAREQALDLLDDLKEMMENLANAELELNLQSNPGGMQSQSPEMEMMDDLADIMRKQQSLLNDSFRQQQQGSRPNQQRDRENALKQEQLRRQLGDTMRDMARRFGGEIPDGLGQAERAMKDAVDGLKGSDREQTLDGQARALNELQRSAKSMADMMSQRAQQGAQQQGQQGQSGQQGQEGQNGQGGQQGQNGEQGTSSDGQGDQQGQGQGGDQAGGTDPLGRSYNPNTDPLDLTPDQARRASREIRDELRRRAGDPNRSQKEQGYIEDLLEEF